MERTRFLLRAILGALENALGRGTTADLNPMRHLGSLSIFMLWIVLVSGIWLFIFFSTSVEHAYESVEYLTHDQWYLGGVMRSLHRYASDLCVITLVLHLFKEFAYDRYRGPRWFSWFTGIPLIWLLIPLGITGYWLVWDRLAQYLALGTAEFIDWLPIFTDVMARNFLSEHSLSNRFFTLMTFLHLIGLPLFLVFGIWLHVFRINGPKINPPRSLMAASLLLMLVLSLVYPAYSQGPVAFQTAITSIGLDWFYLLPYWIMSLTSPGWLWLILVVLTAVLCALSWLPRPRPIQPARVNLEFCNGCERCVDDCPFSAVAMAPRSDGASFQREAVVDPDLCVGCGICTGSCPTATPFRTRSGLVPGIDLDDLTAEQLKAQVLAASEQFTQQPRVLAFACQGSADLARLERSGEVVVALRCMAHLPPPFIDFVLGRDLADGVFMAGCEGGDCRYRLGASWTEQRIQRVRDPQLRKRVDSERIALGWKTPWAGNTAVAINQFRQHLADPEQPLPPASKTGRRLALGLMALIISVGIAWLSQSPSIQLLPPGNAIVSLGFSHAGQRVAECRVLSQDDLNKLPPNMRKPSECPRERFPVEVQVEFDGQSRYHRSMDPSGRWKDGESVFYQRIQVPAGTTTIRVLMADQGTPGDWKFVFEQVLTLADADHVLVEFDHQQNDFLIRE
jgi:ferredoxin/coenzyme F420-reducing hydrogenase delta subunit